MKRREVVSHILVKGCEDGRRWYKDYIGEIFPSLGYMNGEYMTVQPNGYINFVQEEDCEDIGLKYDLTSQ